MEYRHKFMRGTVRSIINKAINDIRTDPRRGIRNLADLGELFSTSPVQRKFIALVRSVLKHPCNPYNELIVKMIRNVETESLQTLSLNFGYTALSYGAKTLRKRQTELGCRIPWLLIYRFDQAESQMDAREQLLSLVAQGAELGIFSFLLQPSNVQDLATAGEICRACPECLFCIAAPAALLAQGQEDSLLQIPNLLLMVEMTGARDWPVSQWEAVEHVFHRLREAERCFGYYAYYSEEDVEFFTSPGFTRRMIQNDCLIGSYINRTPGLEALEDRVYSYVCSERGRNGKPLFVMDFYRDIDYVAKSVSGGDYLVISGGDGTPQVEISLLEKIRGNHRLQSAQ